MIQGISDAYHRQYRNGLPASNTISSATDTGFPIKLIIGESGEIITAYPNLRKPRD